MTALAAALLALMTLPNGHHVVQCRQARGGCEARVQRLAAIMIAAGEREHVDPFLIAAVAFHESALRSDVIGAAGEHGIAQLHPRSRHGMRAARECRVAPSDCDAIELGIAAELLRASIDRCGSEASALGAYNRGFCGETSYSRAVLALRERMRGR